MACIKMYCPGRTRYVFIPVSGRGATFAFHVFLPKQQDEYGKGYWVGADEVTVDRWSSDVFTGWQVPPLAGPRFHGHTKGERKDGS